MQAISPRKNILGMELDDISPQNAIAPILDAAAEPGSDVVRVTNVHQCMECYDNEDFRQRGNTSELVLSDSRILIWAKSLLGFKDLGGLLHGAEIMDALCAGAQDRGLVVGMYGGTEESIDALKQALTAKYPRLNVSFAVSPPFRALSDEEDAAYVQQIADSGVQLLFVGIGCPKQENWMLDHRDRVHCTMIGVGAAFDILGGVTPPSPSWVHRWGLEWLWRTVQEPGRLGKRNLRHNPRFLWFLLLQLLGRDYN